MAVPVILIHGAWATAANWSRIVGLLAPRGYACFTPELPAHEATSDQPLRVRRQGLDDYRAAVRHAVAARPCAQPPVLIGHSLGALLAQQLACELRPLALVLLAPLAPAGVTALAPGRLLAWSPWLAAGLRGGAYRPSFEAASSLLFNSVLPERRRVLHESLVHESGRTALQLGLWPAYGGSAGGVDFDAVRCPVYIVGCGADRLVPPGLPRQLAQRFPGAALRHYPRRGHWVIDDEETEEMIHGICSWLRPLELRCAK